MKRSSLHKLHDLLIQSGRDIEASNLSRYMERVAIEIERDLVMDTETGQPKAQARVQPGTLTHEQMLQLGFGHSQKKGFYYTSDPAVIQRGHETAGTQGGVPQAVQPQMQPLPNDGVAPPAPVARPERPPRATMQDLVPIPIGEMVLNPVERIARSGRPYARYEVEGATMEQRHMLSTAGMNWDKANKVWFVFANKVDEVVATLRIALDASHEGHADMQDKINERKEKKEAENRVDGVLSFGLEGFDEQAYESRNSTDAPPGSETIPQNEKTPFYPYQKGAIVQARGKTGMLLFDDMGVGKTSTAIGMINDRAAMNLPAKNILVIAPLIVRSKWISEIKRFMTGPGLKSPDTGQIELNVGSVRHDVATGGVSFPETDIVVIPWHMLSKFRDQIYSRNWDMVIVDEAHRGKHPGTQWTQVLNGTYDKKQKEYTSAGFSRDQTVLLTGTPPEKSWEYFSLLRIADPGADGSNFVSEQQFRDSFAEQVKMRVPRKGKKDTNAPTGGDDDKQGMMNITVSTGPKNEDILNKILYGGGSTLDGKPINVAGVRRMLEEVQPQLPSFQSSSIEFDPSELLDDPEASKEVYAPNLERAREASKSLNDIQRSGEYGQILNVDRAIQNAIRNNQSTEEIQDLEVKLKQAMKVTFEERSPARVAMGIRKVPVVNQSIDYIRNENPTAKIVVFCVHKEVVQAIVEGERAKAVAEAEATNKENLTRAKAANQPPPELVAPRKVVVITGNESGDARDRAREQFQTDPQVKVIVCTFGAAKEGIELTAGSQLVIAEIPDTLESMDQAQRRIRRIGQTEPAFAHILLDPRGLDYVIYKNLLRNKKVRNAINASSYDRLYRLIIAGV